MERSKIVHSKQFIRSMNYALVLFSTWCFLAMSHTDDKTVIQMSCLHARV